MQSTITVTVLPAQALARIVELDRTEHITQAYRLIDGALSLVSVDWQVPPWSPVDDGSHSVPALLRDWCPILAAGGVLLGALDGTCLAGIGILRYRLTSIMAQLAVLHVSRPYRGRGVGAQLVGEVVRLARINGAQALYVSATPSQATVDFYQAQGFDLTLQPHPELYALEPEDIHLVKYF